MLSWHESKFVSTGAIVRVRAFFGEGTGAILLDEVNCTGTETRLVDCSSNPLGIHNCGHFEDAGVTCQGICRQIGLTSHILYNFLPKPELSMHHIHSSHRQLYVKAYLIYVYLSHIR